MVVSGPSYRHAGYRLEGLAVKALAVVLVIVSVSLLVVVASASTDGRVVSVDGTLRAVLPGDPAAKEVTEDHRIPPGTLLIAPVGSKARIEFGRVGVLTLTGPATVRVDTIDDAPALVLVSGNGSFRFGAGEVHLAVERGRLDVDGVCGYAGTLVSGTGLHLSGDAKAVRVESLRGSAIVSRNRDHVRVRAGESTLLQAISGGFAQKGTDIIRLRSRESEVMIPPETIKFNGTDGDPNLEEMQEDWTQERESPRVP
jgi:hypothetical protein